MRNLTRRGFSGLSLGGLSFGGFAAIGVPTAVHAAGQCTAGNMSPFIPSQLEVDCASQQNFRLFRQYSDYMGLAGVVCLNSCDGRFGKVKAGSLLLFPWLKANARAQALGKSGLKASVSTGSSSSRQAKPIPNPYLPQDEYYCRIVLQAPYRDFIGFLVDAPIGAIPPQADWYSEIPRLADGVPVGIDWTSANLNEAWFGGSRYIPSQNTCSGSAWRALIVAGLNQAAAKSC